MRILVVENHPDTLKYLKMYLESLGHSVTTACTMQAALAASPTEEFDVLISDIGLPDGDGWQLMEQAEFSQPVYAIAISGFAAESDFERSKAAGFRRHIIKPFGGEDLCEVLDEAAREIQAQPPVRRAKSSTPPPARKTPAARKKSAALTLQQIANRLHDSTCQNLLGAQLLLYVLREQPPQDAGEMRELVEKVQGLVDQACTELGALMKEMVTQPPGKNTSRKIPPKPTTRIVAES